MPTTMGTIIEGSPTTPTPIANTSISNNNNNHQLIIETQSACPLVACDGRGHVLPGFSSHRSLANCPKVREVGMQQQQQQKQQQQQQSKKGQQVCTTPGCDGSGNTKNIYDCHRSAQRCPILKARLEALKGREYTDEQFMHYMRKISDGYGPPLNGGELTAAKDGASTGTLSFPLVKSTTARLSKQRPKVERRRVAACPKTKASGAAKMNNNNNKQAIQSETSVAVTKSGPGEKNTQRVHKRCGKLSTTNHNGNGKSTNNNNNKKVKPSNSSEVSSSEAFGTNMPPATANYSASKRSASSVGGGGGGSKNKANTVKTATAFAVSAGKMANGVKHSPSLQPPQNVLVLEVNNTNNNNKKNAKVNSSANKVSKLILDNKNTMVASKSAANRSNANKASSKKTSKQSSAQPPPTAASKVANRKGQTKNGTTANKETKLDASACKENVQINSNGKRLASVQFISDVAKPPDGKRQKKATASKAKASKASKHASSSEQVNETSDGQLEQQQQQYSIQSNEQLQFRKTMSTMFSNILPEFNQRTIIKPDCDNTVAPVSVDLIDEHCAHLQWLLERSHGGLNELHDTELYFARKVVQVQKEIQQMKLDKSNLQDMLGRAINTCQSIDVLKHLPNQERVNESLAFTLYLNQIEQIIQNRNNSEQDAALFKVLRSNLKDLPFYLS